MTIRSGDHVRDFLHVDDVADALCRVVDSDIEGPVNVASGIPLRIRDLALAIGREVGRPELVQFQGPAPEGDPKFICADVRLLRKTTCWQPAVSLEAGIARTVREATE